jgi:hypothetical protein
MARVTHSNRTVLIVLGHQELPSDLAGRHYIRLDGTSGRLNELANSLHAAGCEIDTSGTDWLDLARFLLATQSLRPLKMTVFGGDSPVKPQPGRRSRWQPPSEHCRRRLKMTPVAWILTPVLACRLTFLVLTPTAACCARSSEPGIWPADRQRRCRHPDDRLLPCQLAAGPAAASKLLRGPPGAGIERREHRRGLRLHGRLV